MNEESGNPQDPSGTDALFDAAAQFFTQLREKAQAQGAPQEALDKIENHAGVMEQYRKEDALIEAAVAEAEAEYEAFKDEEPEAAEMGALVISWLAELRDRRRSEAGHFAMAAQGGCGGCGGCGA